MEVGETMFEEREYQTKAIEANISDYDKGTHRIMNVMATGTGKTVIFAKMFEAMKSRLPGQMLVVAHTEELVTQNLEKMQTANPTLKIGKEMSGEWADTDSDIISACVATTGRQGQEKRNGRFNWDNIDKVVIDEAHHSTQESYGRVLALSGVDRPETHKFLLGVTATPQRPDGKALSDIFEKVSYVYSLRQAIADKWLVPIRGYRVTTTCSLSEVSKGSGDFIKSELSHAVNTPERNKLVVEAWQKMGEDRQTIAFTVDIEHAEKLAKEFNDAGTTAQAVWGDDPDRKAKIEAHQRGEFRVLCNCSVLTEGYDDPSVSCILLARPTTSGVLFAQMVGRGTRLNPGKSDLIVIDVVDTSVTNTLLTLPTLMGVSNHLDLKGGYIDRAVEILEEAQAEHPGLDLAKLESLDKLKSFIEQVDLMTVKFPKEVEENSELTWFKAVDGGYKMLIPKEGPEKAGWMRIYENQLGQWDIVGRIKDVDLKASRPTMEEAFKATDEQVRKRLTKMTLSYLLRSATWHGKPVTSGQVKMLTRLFPHRAFNFPQMTSGQASKIISERLAKKAVK
jgi:ATP-dependent helicase IRC3